MTTEHLRLEIQVLVKEALVNLRETTAEYKNLADEAKRAVPSQAEFRASVARMEHDLKTSAQAAKLFGDEIGGLKEQQARLKSGITDLIDKGLSPESKEVKDLKARYDETTEALRRHGGGVDDLRGKLESMLTAGALIAATKKIGDAIGQAVGEFASAEASAQRLDVALQMRGMESAKTGLQDLASRMQELAGIDADMVTQLEAELVAQGKSRTEIEKTITAAAGLSAITGGDLNASVQMLNTTYSGSAMQLGRMIPEIKDLTEEQLKNGAAVDVIAEKYSQYIGQTGITQIAMSRMQASLGDATETFGSIFAPVVVAAANVISGFAKAISNASPAVKTIAGIITGILLGALIGATIRTVALTLAKWGLFGAEMAVNSAMAVGNPLLWIGIAAAVAAVATTAALIAAKSREAQVVSEGAEAQREAAAAYDLSSEAQKRYQKSLEDTQKGLAAWLSRGQKLDAEKKFGGMNVDELKKNVADMKGMFEFAYMTGQNERANMLDKELTTAEAILDKKVKDAEAAAKRIADFRASWAKDYAKFITDSSADPYASIESEREQKITEALSKGIAENDELITQINEVYDAKRMQLGWDISKKEIEALAKVTETRIDDLEIEKTKAIESFQGTEETRRSIAAYYDKQIAETRIEETKKAAEAAFDLQNKERAAAAKLTETQVDDLELARDRELELFEGTEKQKAIIAAQYAQKIADAQVQEAQRAFQESLELARKNKNYASLIGLSFQEQTKSTDIGKMAGFGGAAAVDPVTMLLEDLLKLALEVENVQKLMSPFGTVLEGMFMILEPLLDSDLASGVDALLEMGMALGEVVAPFISIFGIALSIAAGIMKVLIIPALQLVGAAFKWVNNYVIVPFGNAIIWVVNAVIDGINSALGWLGVHINRLAELQPIQDTYVASQTELASQVEGVNDTMDDVRKIFEKKKDQLQDAYDANIRSIQDLLEVGAISLTQYDQMVSGYNTKLDTDLAQLESAEEAQLDALKEMLERLNKGIAISNLEAVLAAALAQATSSVASFDTGTTKVNANQLAVVHKGETIIPASFAEGIRNGELSLGAGSGSTNITQISLIVKGSVLTDEDLVAAVAKGQAQARRRGRLPSEALN